MFFRSPFLVAFIVAAVGPVMSAPSPPRDNVGFPFFLEGETPVQVPPQGSTSDAPAPAPIDLQTRKIPIGGIFDAATFVDQLFSGSNSKRELTDMQNLLERKFGGMGIGDLFSVASFADQVATTNLKRELAHTQDLMTRKFTFTDFLKLPGLKRDVVPLETDPEAPHFDLSFGQDSNEQKRELAHLQDLMERKRMTWQELKKKKTGYAKRDVVPLDTDPEAPHSDLSFGQDSNEQKKRELAHMQDLLERKFGGMGIGDLFSVASFADQVATTNLKRYNVPSETDLHADANLSYLPPALDVSESDIKAPTPTLSEVEARRVVMLSPCWGPAATGTGVINTVCQESESLDSEVASHLKRTESTLSRVLGIAGGLGDTGASISNVVADVNRLSPEPKAT